MKSLFQHFEKEIYQYVNITWETRKREFRENTSVGVSF